MGTVNLNLNVWKVIKVNGPKGKNIHIGSILLFISRRDNFYMFTDVGKRWLMKSRLTMLGQSGVVEKWEKNKWKELGL